MPTQSLTTYGKIERQLIVDKPLSSYHTLLSFILYVIAPIQLVIWNEKGWHLTCPGGAIGSVAVHATWLQWPTSLGSRPRLVGSFVSAYGGVCFKIKFSGRHRWFDSVLFKLWPLANTGFRGAQSLVPAWTTDNRWRSTASSGRPLMVLFPRVAKLGSGAYGARYARVRPSVMQCVLAVRDSGYKAEQVKYRGTRPLQFPSPFPPLALIHTSLSKREVAQHLHFTHTVVSRYTTFVPPLRSCIGTQASTLVRDGARSTS